MALSAATLLLFVDVGMVFGWPVNPAGGGDGRTAAIIAEQSTNTPHESSEGRVVVEVPRPVSDDWKRFSELPLWEDGLSEMSYYETTCVIYGKQRKSTRVHLFNRQFMDERKWIKTDERSAQGHPAFKLVISEEVPTENYNYRFLTTVFVERPGLEPIKVSATSQDWCGHTYKSLLWSRFQEVQPPHWSLNLRSFSYFPGEGDRSWVHPSSVDAYESLFIFARAVVASGGQARPMHLLKSLRSNHGPDPKPLDALLRVDGDPRQITVPLGSFEAQRVVLDWAGETTWFDVETAAPFRILAFQAADVEAQLRFVERRAYWDRRWKSGFYPPGQAP